MLKATNIIWDADTPEETNGLPTEIEIPAEYSGDDEAISNYITDLTGFCHKGFAVCEFPDNYAELYERVWGKDCSSDELFAICQKCKHRDTSEDTADTISWESCFHICVNCPVHDAHEALQEATAEAYCS